MNCFDCAATGHVTTAIAVCHDCGTAVCAEHAVARDHHLTRTATINRLIVVEPPGRLIRCLVCTAAHDAVWHGPATTTSTTTTGVGATSPATNEPSSNGYLAPVNCCQGTPRTPPSRMLKFTSRVGNAAR